MQHRRQIGGPARGYAQFELNGGVLGVLTHHASADHARAICDILDIKPAPSVVYGALEFQDVLAAAFARLLLWTDPSPLPPREDDQAAWDIYLRTWRPGKPHPETWAAHYRRAWETVAATDDRDVSGTPMTED